MQNKEVLAYKGFDNTLKCRNYQFEVGGTFEHRGEVIVNESGFHACENPLGVFGYYSPVNSRFAVVKCSGDIRRQEDSDGKIACGKLTVEAELKLHELIKKGADWILSKVELNDKKSKDANNSTSVATGYGSTSATSGDWSMSVATGDWSTSATSGDWSTSATTGYKSTSATTGDWSMSATTGYKSMSVATGYGSTSATSGDWSMSVATGDWSTSVATGYGSMSATTGDWSMSATTWGWSTSATTGYKSTSVATGDNSAAEVSGEYSVACALGSSSKARAGENGAIVCVHIDNDTKKIVHIKASKVGDNGIKPNTWYTLDSDGNFKEVE